MPLFSTVERSGVTSVLDVEDELLAVEERLQIVGVPVQLVDEALVDEQVLDLAHGVVVRDRVRRTSDLDIVEEGRVDVLL